MAAVLGISQLKRLDAMQRRRSEIAGAYIEAFREIPGIEPAGIGKMKPADRHSWCVFPIFVDESKAGISRDAMVEALAGANIGTSVHYIPTHMFSSFRNVPHGKLPVTEALWERLISLPLYPLMTDSDIDDVVTAVRRIVDRTAASAI
jgi:dTDP-4-amino-4,6-dideoxygalactose transaminase